MSFRPHLRVQHKLFQCRIPPPSIIEVSRFPSAKMTNSSSPRIIFVPHPATEISSIPSPFLPSSRPRQSCVVIILNLNLLVSLDFYFKCCEGHVVRRVGGSHAKCCGAHTYDSRFFFCYQRLIYPLCRKLTYNPTTQQCCAGVVNRRIGGDHSSCCYTKSYDGRVNFCYEKKVYGRCQSKSYNPHSYICCENKIRPHFGGLDTKCCKDKSYDSRRSVTTL